MLRGILAHTVLTHTVHAQARAQRKQALSAFADMLDYYGTDTERVLGVMTRPDLRGIRDGAECARVLSTAHNGRGYTPVLIVHGYATPSRVRLLVA